MTLKQNQPKTKGEITEAVLLAEFVKKGYVVLLPFGDNQRYDMVIDIDGETFLRVQCKTGRLRKGAVKFNTLSTRLNSQGYYERGYSGQIDMFAVYCSETEGVYLVPIAEIKGHTCSLRVDPPKNNQSRHIRWARDFEL